MLARAPVRPAVPTPSPLRISVPVDAPKRLAILERHRSLRSHSNRSRVAQRPRDLKIERAAVDRDRTGNAVGHRQRERAPLSLLVREATLLIPAPVTIVLPEPATARLKPPPATPPVRVNVLPVDLRIDLRIRAERDRSGIGVRPSGVAERATGDRDWPQIRSASPNRSPRLLPRYRHSNCCWRRFRSRRAREQLPRTPSEAMCPMRCYSATAGFRRKSKSIR